MYALLQISLEPPVTRDVLERAITATKDLARPDGARLVREMFGIIARNLTQADALALQAALQANDVPAEVVDEAVLPALPQPRHIRALNLSETGFEPCRSVQLRIVISMEGDCICRGRQPVASKKYSGPKMGEGFLDRLPFGGRIHTRYRLIQSQLRRCSRVSFGVISARSNHPAYSGCLPQTP